MRVLLGGEHGVRTVRRGLGGGEIEIGQTLLRILGDIHQDRTGAAGLGDQEGLAKHRGDILRAGDDVVVLGDGQGDAGDVDFLEGIGAEQLGGDLAGDADHGNRVHHGRGDAGDEIGGAGAGGGDGDADFAGGAGVSVGGMGRALLVAHQDVADRVFAQSVVDGQDGAAGIAKHFANTLAFEGGPDDLSAGEARGLAGGGCRYFAHCGSSILHVAAAKAVSRVQARCCVQLWPRSLGNGALSELANDSLEKRKDAAAASILCCFIPQPSAHLFDDRFNARLLPRAWAGRRLTLRLTLRITRRSAHASRFCS